MKIGKVRLRLKRYKVWINKMKVKEQELQAWRRKTAAEKSFIFCDLASIQNHFSSLM